jgi:hypothetical protein
MTQMIYNFEHPNWNRASVQEALDYNVVFGRLTENLEHLITLTGFEKLDVFSRSAKWMKCVKAYVEAKMAALPQTAVGNGSDQMLDFGASAGPDDLTDFFQFLDEAWMTENLESGFQVGPMAGT